MFDFANTFDNKNKIKMRVLLDYPDKNLCSNR